MNDRGVVRKQYIVVIPYGLYALDIKIFVIAVYAAVPIVFEVARNDNAGVAVFDIQDNSLDYIFVIDPVPS